MVVINGSFYIAKRAGLRVTISLLKPKPCVIFKFDIGYYSIQISDCFAGQDIP